MRKHWVKRLIPAVCAGIFCFAGAFPVSAATGQSLRAVPIEKTGENRVVSGLAGETSGGPGCEGKGGDRLRTEQPGFDLDPEDRGGR